MEPRQRKAALHDASPVPYSRSSLSKEKRSGPTLYVSRPREYGSAASTRHLNQAAFTVWFHDVADSKLSQSALPSEKRELLPEELLLELDESLHSDGVATVSVLGERSASAMSLRARMSSIVVQDFSGGMLAPLAVASVVASAVASGGEKPLVCVYPDPTCRIHEDNQVNTCILYFSSAQIEYT